MPYERGPGGRITGYEPADEQSADESDPPTAPSETSPTDPGRSDVSRPANEEDQQRSVDESESNDGGGGVIDRGVSAVQDLFREGGGQSRDLDDPLDVFRERPESDPVEGPVDAFEERGDQADRGVQRPRDLFQEGRQREQRGNEVDADGTPPAQGQQGPTDGSPTNPGSTGGPIQDATSDVVGAFDERPDGGVSEPASRSNRDAPDQQSQVNGAGGDDLGPRVPWSDSTIRPVSATGSSVTTRVNRPVRRTQATRAPEGPSPARNPEEHFGDWDWSFGLGDPEEDEVEQTVDRLPRQTGEALRPSGETLAQNTENLSPLIEDAGYPEVAEDYDDFMTNVTRYSPPAAGRAVTGIPATAMETVELATNPRNTEDLPAAAVMAGQQQVEAFQQTPGKATAQLVTGAAIGRAGGRLVGNTRLGTGRSGRVLSTLDVDPTGRVLRGAESLAGRGARRVQDRVPDIDPDIRRNLRQLASDDRGQLTFGSRSRSRSQPDVDDDFDVEPTDGGGTFADVRQDALTQRQDYLRDLARREGTDAPSVDPDMDPVSGRPGRTLDPETGRQFDRYGDRIEDVRRRSTEPELDTDFGDSVTVPRRTPDAEATSPDLDVPDSAIRGAGRVGALTGAAETQPLDQLTATTITEDPSPRNRERPRIDIDPDTRQRTDPDTRLEPRPRTDPDQDQDPTLDPDPNVDPDPVVSPDPDPDPTPDPLFSPDPETRRWFDDDDDGDDGALFGGGWAFTSDTFETGVAQSLDDIGLGDEEDPWDFSNF